MHLGERRRRNKIHHEVAIRHRVYTVGGYRLETQRTRDQPPINRKRARRESARTKRHHRGACRSLLESLAVAAEHLDVGEQMMRQRHRLRALEMRITGNDRAKVPLRDLDERGAEFADKRYDLRDLVAKK